jgi:hypothetical protein
MTFPIDGWRGWAGSIASALALAWVMSGVGDAQVLRVPDPRLPRMAGGQPNLTAMAPKTRDGQPDLSGIWHVADARYLNNLGADAAPPLTPAGAALYRERQAAAAKDRPAGRSVFAARGARLAAGPGPSLEDHADAVRARDAF